MTIITEIEIIVMDVFMETVEATMETIKIDANFHGVEASHMALL